MKDIELKCGICPIKCKIQVRVGDDGEIKRTTGYGCTRGKNFAMEELLSPRAIFTGEITVSSGENTVKLPVRTTRPIPREGFSYAEDILSKITPALPIKKGESIIIDFIERGVNLIALADAE